MPTLVVQENKIKTFFNKNNFCLQHSLAAGASKAVLSSTVATSHTWLLSTRNAPSAANPELYLIWSRNKKIEGRLGGSLG